MKGKQEVTQVSLCGQGWAQEVGRKMRVYTINDERWPAEDALKAWYIEG
jgi:hypothetical protein